MEGDRSMHLIIDGRASNKELLQGETLLRNWLVKIANSIGMTVYGEPVVIDYPWPGSEYTALSAICFLGESSIVVHTYPEHMFVFLDIFSCKDFNFIKLERVICHDFGIALPKVLQLERGVHDGDIVPVRIVGE